MIKTPSLEALKAAAKMAGFAKPDSVAIDASMLGEVRTDFALNALADMIAKHEPELIAESFDERTAREVKNLCLVASVTVPYETCLAQYRQYIRQYKDEVK